MSAHLLQINNQKTKKTTTKNKQTRLKQHDIVLIIIFLKCHTWTIMGPMTDSRV